MARRTKSRAIRKPRYSHPKVKTVHRVARFFEVAEATIYRWIDKGLPNNPETDEFDLHECRKWHMQHIVAPSLSENDERERELKLRQLEQKTLMADLEIAEREGKLVLWKHVVGFLEETSLSYRRAGELLRRHFGADAQGILLEAIDANEQKLNNLIGDEREES